MNNAVEVITIDIAQTSPSGVIWGADHESNICFSFERSSDKIFFDLSSSSEVRKVQ